MLTIERLKLAHFDVFEPIDIQALETQNTIEFIKQTDIGIHNAAVFDNGKIVLIFGLFELWQGVFSSYTLFSKHWKPMYYRTVTRFFREYIKELDFDRIQHMVSCDRKWTHKMAKLFGFKNETPEPLKKYMYGKDYYMYAIVRE